MNNEEQKNSAVDAAEKIAAATSRKKIAETAKKAAQLAARLIAKAISMIVASLGGWVVLAIFAVAIAFLILFTAVWDYVSNVADALTGAFTSESTHYKTTDEELGLADAVSGVFYTRFSEQSYYIMIDDDPKVYQAGSNEFIALQNTYGVKVEDIDKRESQFAISPTMLSLLDQNLNEGYLHPEQFIKPVYNDCMSDLNSGVDNVNTRCKLLSLVDESGNLVANSVYYHEREDIASKQNDIVGDSNRYSERTDAEVNFDLETGIFDKNPGSYTKGVWNWGLASIVHYTSFEQDSRISDYRIQSAIIWDTEARTTKEITGFFTDPKKAEYVLAYGFKEPEEIITYETQTAAALENDNGLSLAVPATETKFAIDSAVTFLGDISNEVKQSYLYQGKSGGTKTINNYYYEYGSNWREAASDGGERRAYIGSVNIKDILRKNDEDAYGHLTTSGAYKTGFTSVTWTPEKRITWMDPNPNYNEEYCKLYPYSELDYCTKEWERVHIEPAKFCFDDGTCYEGEENALTFTVRYNPTLSYYKEGNLETNAVQYINSLPDTSGIVGLDYLEDYILNYEAYLPYEENRSETYKCFEKISSLVEQGVDPAGYSYNLTDSYTAVNSVSQCSNGSFVAKTNSNGLMDKFYFDDMPLLHVAKIAEILNIPVDGVQILKEEKIEAKDIDITLKNITEDVKTAARNATEKMYGSDKKIQSYFDDSATKYGIDVNLLSAIFAHNPNLRFNETLSAYNFATRDYDNNVTVKSDSEIKLQIQALAMKLQNLLKNYNYNVILAIQALNDGTEKITEILNIYEAQTGVPPYEAIENVSDFGWTAYTFAAGSTNYDYVSEIMLYLPTKMLSFQSAADDASKHSMKKVDLSKMYDVSNENWSDAATNRAAIEKVYRAIKGTLNNSWKTLTLNQKDYHAGSYTDSYAFTNPTAYLSDLKFESSIQKNITNKSTDVAFRVFGKLQNAIDREIFIKKLFAYQNGESYHDYNVMDDQFWMSKYAALFSSVGGKNWISNVDVSSIFGGFITLPVETHTVQKEFGWIENDFGYRELNTVTEYVTTAYSEVKLPYEGVVTSVSTTETPEYGKYIEILHSGDSDSATITRYLYLGEIADNVVAGAELNTGDLLGKVKEDGVLGIQLIIDGTYNDFGEVVRVVEDYYQAEYLLYSVSGSGGPQNEKVIDYLQELLKVADEVENVLNANPAVGWDLSSITDTSGGRRSGGTWYYDNSTKEHPGLDWSTNKVIGKDFYAFGNIIYLNFMDNCIDYPAYTSYSAPQNSSLLACNGRYGNKLVVVFRHEDGHLYVMTLLHGMHESMKNAFPDDYTSDNPASFVVEKGTVIAKSGHTGYSTGPHEHIEIVKFASNYTLKDVINRYIETNYNNHFGIGYLPAPQARCEDNKNAAICKERPDRVLKW